MPTTAPCPVCATPAKGTGQEVYTAVDAATHFCTPSRDPDRHTRLVACIRRLWGQDTTEVLSCPSCGFGFGHPHVGGDAEFYSIIHEDFGYPADRWEYAHAIAAITSRFPSGGKALDVGTGDGAFLDRLPSSWSKLAIESTDTMRTFLRGKNITAFATADQALETLGPNTCNAITLFQCIEHVSQFHPMLVGLRKLLAPGGILVVSTPNAEELTRQQHATHSPDMPPNHINKWSTRSLSLAFEHAAFRLVHAELQPPGWNQLPYSVYLRVRSDAAQHPTSLAARTYSIRDRKKRGRMLKLVGLLTAPRLLPHLKDAKLAANLMALGEPV